ncbi:hypothetical protein GW17_00045251, partial [Ensete ventricosum]
MGTARICPPTDRYVDHPLSGGTYQFVSRSVRKPPSIGQYHRLRLFSPRYHSKLVGNGRFRPSTVDFGRYQPMDNEEEGEEKGEPGAWRCSPDPDPLPTGDFFSRVRRRNVSPRGEKEQAN